MMGHKRHSWDEAFAWSVSGSCDGFILRLSQGVKLMKGVCILTAVALLAAAPILLWSAEDGAALFGSRCAMCHGAKGEGVPDAKLPAIKGTSMTIEKIITYLTKGDKEKTIHADPISDINQEQAKAIAEHVKKLK
jgi:mono/diheme cytochrome c family protein